MISDIYSEKTLFGIALSSFVSNRRINNFSSDCQVEILAPSLIENNRLLESWVK